MKQQEFEFVGMRLNGFVAICLDLLLLVIAVLGFAEIILHPLVSAFIVILVAVSLGGFMMLEPNEARVMIFFGKYKGTFRGTGFYWVNPFMTRKALSLRARNLDAEPIKVNDKVGNPILIGMVLVWRLKDSYKAMFEIDSQTMANAGTVSSRMAAFEKFVRIQSDAALRQVAGLYAYDNIENEDSSSANEMTLRDGGDEINEQLEAKLNERLSMAGIEVLEARLNYLTYAPEIAAVMLRRQQAAAVIAAREKIVEGAVTMVEMALKGLENKKIVNFDDVQKAALVSNLLVVLCSEESAQPVVNTGNRE